jgi:integrase/recombinase XerD
MSRPKLPLEPWIARLQEHCQRERYSVGTARNYTAAARRFLRSLERRGKALKCVSVDDLESYLDALRPKRAGNPAREDARWTAGAAIRMLLRVVLGAWPPETEATTASAIDANALVAGYDAWLALRGLSTVTRERIRAEARRLLCWFSDQGKPVRSLSIADLDAYIAWRGASMRRTSIALLASDVRGFMRHLYGVGQVPVNLADDISGPRIYALEEIPSAIQPEHVKRALQSARADKSALGRRDYAILMLLSTYGLRSGEVTGLRLADVDWRQDRLHIRHTKTGAQSELPLLRGAADALLDYLKHGRPTTTRREVFLRLRAPYRPLSSAAALRKLINRRLKTVGVVLTGKRGAHVFRHGRAVSMLRTGVPLKVIGDVLGHRSARSTSVYLKLATEDLRSVSLEVPEGESQ